jgi:hypothetical protein
MDMDTDPGTGIGMGMAKDTAEDKDMGEDTMIMNRHC